MALDSRIFKIAALVFVAALFSLPVSAQELRRGETVTDRARPDLDPLGIRLGSFLF
jgi:hypothetical protein